MASHPSPGNRVKYVSEQNKLLPKKSYSEPDGAALPQMKRIIANLPPPPKPLPQAGAPGGQPGGGQPGGGQPGGGQPAGDPRPSGRYREHRGPDFVLNYPDNWEVFGDPNAESVTIAPRAGLVQDQQGQVHIGYGIMTSYYFPQKGKANLQRDTTALVKQLQTSGVRQTANPKSVKVGGQNALLTPMESQSPFQQGQREIDMLLTIARGEALYYMVFIAPETEWATTQAAFDNVVASLKFTR